MGTGLLVVVGLLVLLALYGIFSGLFTIHTQEIGVVERFGKFHKLAHPGLNFKVPFIDTLRARLSLRVEQLEVKVDTKTKDNVFVRIPVTIQYQVAPTREKDAFYALNNPEAQMVAYVQDNVRTSLAVMDLDEVFESKDTIAQHVEDTLSEKMTTYGWNIIATLVTDIIPADEVTKAMNNINAQHRNKLAMMEQAEANKIQLVKAAEAEAEAKRLQGEGIANERKAIVDGLAEQLQTLEAAGVKDNPEGLLMLTQYFDTLRDLARNGKSNILFVPSSPEGMGNLGQEIQKAMLSTEFVKRNQA